MFSKKSLEKNPTNGGTPASEKIKMVMKNKWKLSKLKRENEYKVFISLFTNEKNTQNKPITDKLYMNMYKYK